MTETLLERAERRRVERRALPGFNRHGVWLGPVERFESPTLKSWWKRVVIEVARTPRGWEYCVHAFGGGYGIGKNDPSTSREEAIRAAVDECRRDLARVDRLNGKDAVPSVLAYLDTISPVGGQFDLFGLAAVGTLHDRPSYHRRDDG